MDTRALMSAMSAEERADAVRHVAEIDGLAAAVQAVMEAAESLADGVPGSPHARYLLPLSQLHDYLVRDDL